MKKGIKSGKDIKCITCGKFFYAIPARVNTAKYCSRKCSGGTVEIKCATCGGKKVHSKSRVKSGNGKYCSKKCSDIGQKGSKRPHSKEWEQKRLLAVRKYSKNNLYLKGYKRPKEHTIGMVEALKKSKKNNPQKFRETSIKNLSKSKTLDLSGKNSPQWRGGLTKEARRIRNKYSNRIEKFREIVLLRDNYTCKQCGSKEKLEVHHIISFKELPEASYLPMNGVTLCKTCHKKTDTFGAKGIKNKYQGGSIGKTTCIGRSIPHIFQAYNTIGNYAWTDSGILIIFISDLGNDKYNELIFLHEFIESNLCKFAGIKEEDISKFDIEFEKNRKEGNIDEPGFDKDAPYRHEHLAATGIEMIMASLAGIEWSDYDKKVNEL